MLSRRDQVQAQSHVIGRLTSAMVAAEPEAPENPHRRTTVGTFIGVVVAALVVVGFAAYGLLVPGGATAWRKPGVLIVEKETGSRYVLVDGALHPVLNYVSALMLFEGKPNVVGVSTASLRGVPHGLPVGIVGAPDALPGSDAMTRQVWSACALSGRDAAGTTLTATTLRIGRADAAPVHLLGEDEAVLVDGADRRGYLIWRGKRYAVTQNWLARALGYEQSRTSAQIGWLDTLPAGPDITPARVPGRGEPGKPIGGAATVVGQLFVARVKGIPDRNYVLQRDGLSALNETAYAIVAGDPDTARAYGNAPVVPRVLDAAAIAQTPVSSVAVLPSGLPEAPPRAATAPPNTVWCARYSADDGQVRVSAERPMDSAHAVYTSVAVGRTSRTAAAIEVEPGVGGLVRPGWPGAAPSWAYAVVTDAGVRYPVATTKVAEMLGYAAGDAVTVPPPLLDLLPTGPVLDPADLGR